MEMQSQWHDNTDCFQDSPTRVKPRLVSGVPGICLYYRFGICLMYHKCSQKNQFWNSEKGHIDCKKKGRSGIGLVAFDESEDVH